MQDKKYDVVVIGGGAAGLTSSIWSAQLGQKALIIEKEKKLGGDCLHYGCVPSKALIKSAQVHHYIKRATDYGLPQVDVKPVDFANVRARIQGIIGHIQKNDSPEFFKRQYKIDTDFGNPQFLNHQSIRVNGQTIHAKKIIIATGSRPRILPLDGLDTVPYLTNINIFSLEKLPESMIVLGGGPIGLEMAQAFLRLGSKVSVVEVGPAILPKEDIDVSQLMQDHLRKEGMEIHVASKAVKVEKLENGIRLTIDQGGNLKSLDASCLLVATGRQPNVEDLDLQKAGIEFAPSGIKVNAHLQTTAQNIYACGDCTGGLMFTHVAEADARIAALNARLPFPILKAKYDNVPWVTYVDPEVASVGLNETMAKQAGIDYKMYQYDFAHIDRALAEGATTGFVKIITDRQRRLIGAQIVGLHAGELIHEWVAVMNGKVDLGKIEKSIHAYPTLSQINKKVSGSYLAAQSPLIKILTYLFQ